MAKRSRYSARQVRQILNVDSDDEEAGLDSVDTELSDFDFIQVYLHGVSADWFINMSAFMFSTSVK